jgi:hypothetical protein
MTRHQATPGFQTGNEDMEKTDNKETEHDGTANNHNGIGWRSARTLYDRTGSGMTILGLLKLCHTGEKNLELQFPVI